MPVLLNADDTFAFGTNENDFQNSLDMLFEYKELWHLNINFDKVKILDKTNVFILF